MTFKLPVSVIAEIDVKATTKGETRSEFLRSMIDRELSGV
ncbi:MAG: type II toxin-antitoxin system HicB family antitoxin [Coriobacteriales bacterium]|nr:type II toxin-antitoxin system HicB family antitoxin [Coriobacteriales bacterium]